MRERGIDKLDPTCKRARERGKIGELAVALRQAAVTARELPARDKTGSQSFRVLLVVVARLER